jgi:hypothetical protein
MSGMFYMSITHRIPIDNLSQFHAGHSIKLSAPIVA